jgi:hypothetical protein
VATYDKLWLLWQPALLLNLINVLLVYSRFRLVAPNIHVRTRKLGGDSLAALPA